MNIIGQEELCALSTQNAGASGHGPYRVFGDSHVLWMCAHHTDIFEVHWFIGRTAYNLQKHLDLVMPCIDARKPNLFLLGTVDATFHIGKYRKNGSDAQRQQDIITTCQRYLDALRTVQDCNVEVAAISCCPMGDRATEDGILWNDIILKSNGIMRVACASEGIDFIDAYRYWVHPLSGERTPTLVADEWHLNAAAGHILAVCVHDFYQNKHRSCV